MFQTITMVTWLCASILGPVSYEVTLDQLLKQRAVLTMILILTLTFCNETADSITPSFHRTDGGITEAESQ